MSAAGSAIVTRAPGAAAAADADPPWARAIASTIARPSPAPPPLRPASGRAKRSKARPAKPGGKPGPWSRTAIRTSPSPSSPLSSIRPSPCASALSSMFVTAGSSRCRSAITVSPRGASTTMSPRRRLRATLSSSSRTAMPLRRDRQLPLVGAREHEQVLREPDQPVGLLAARGQRGAQLRRRAVARERDVDLRLEDRQRGAQLVAGVGDEAALLRQRLPLARSRTSRAGERQRSRRLVVDRRTSAAVGRRSRGSRAQREATQQPLRAAARAEPDAQGEQRASDSRWSSSAAPTITISSPAGTASSRAGSPSAAPCRALEEQRPGAGAAQLLSASGATPARPGSRRPCSRRIRARARSSPPRSTRPGERASARLAPVARSADTSAARVCNPASTVRVSSLSKRRYTNAPAASSTTASAAANATVTRRRIGSRLMACASDSRRRGPSRSIRRRTDGRSGRAAP